MEFLKILKTKPIIKRLDLVLLGKRAPKFRLYVIICIYLENSLETLLK